MTHPTRLHLAAQVRKLRTPRQYQPRNDDPTEREMSGAAGHLLWQTNGAIATALNVSEDTVKTYIRRLYRKFGINDRAHLVRAGFERGVLTAQAPGYSHFAVRGPKAGVTSPCTGPTVIELDEVDLAKDLSRLSRRLAQASADIVTELDSPERTYELAGLLEVAVRQLRTRALAALPALIESHYPQETAVTERDHSTAAQDLAATLTELLTRLRLVAPALADQLADTLTEMAHQLDPADVTARLEELAMTLHTGTGQVSGPCRDDARGVQTLVGRLRPVDTLAGTGSGNPPRAPDGPSDGWGSSWKVRIPARPRRITSVSGRRGCCPTFPRPRLPVPPNGKAHTVKEASTISAESELTEQDRVIAALVENIEQQLPGGYQVHVDIRLGMAIRTVEKMFTTRKLPLREQLIAELTLWQCHTKDGIRLMERSYQLLHNVIRMIDATRDPNQ